MSVETEGISGDLGPDNRAFQNALNTGFFEALTPFQLERWGQLTQIDKSIALLPFRKDPGHPVCNTDPLSYVIDIINNGKPRY